MLSSFFVVLDSGSHRVFPLFVCLKFYCLTQALSDEALADLLTAWYHAGLHAGRAQTIAALRSRVQQQ